MIGASGRDVARLSEKTLYAVTSTLKGRTSKGKEQLVCED